MPGWRHRTSARRSLTDEILDRCVGCAPTMLIQYLKSTHAARSLHCTDGCLYVCIPECQYHYIGSERTHLPVAAAHGLWPYVLCVNVLHVTIWQLAARVSAVLWRPIGNVRHLNKLYTTGPNTFNTTRRVINNQIQASALPVRSACLLPPRSLTLPSFIGCSRDAFSRLSHPRERQLLCV